MANNATNTLQATLTSADQNGVISITRSAGNPQLGGNVGEMSINQLLANGDNVITLPIAQVVNLYVKNNAAPGSGQKVVPKITPGGGVQGIWPAIEPQGVFYFWNVINTDLAGSIVALTLNSNGANVPVEIFFGG